MSNIWFWLTIGAAIVAAILLIRRSRHRDSSTYRRRFVNGAPRHASTPLDHDTAFPFASTLYVGDGGASSHAHHHSVDCAHASDGGGGCSDGGGGGT